MKLSERYESYHMTHLFFVKLITKKSFHFFQTESYRKVEFYYQKKSVL